MPESTATDAASYTTLWDTIPTDHHRRLMSIVKTHRNGNHIATSDRRKPIPVH